MCVCVLVNWLKLWEPAEAEMNTWDWGAFNAMDHHTSDVLLALSDTGRKEGGERKKGVTWDSEQSDEEKYHERKTETREGEDKS